MAPAAGKLGKQSARHGGLDAHHALTASEGRTS